MEKYLGMADEELAMLYVGGENSAFDELLSRNQEKIYSYILFFVKNEEVANDLFQDTFVKVITKLHEGRYAPQGKFSYWLMRIAHNVVIDWFRNQSSECVVEMPADNDLSNLRVASVMDESREGQMLRSQVLRDVRRLLDRLPAPQREVAYMRFYQELSFKEIAEITSVSINTALGRMRYAVLNMRRMAKRHGVVLNADF